MEHVGTQNIEEGNNRPPLKKKDASRVNPSRFWCFTMFDTEIDDIIGDLEHGIDYIIGNEICPTTNKKHLQGWISSVKRIRPMEKFNWKCHWTRCKGNAKQNIKYCSKEGDYVASEGLFEKYMVYMLEEAEVIVEIWKYCKSRNNLISKENVCKCIFELMYRRKLIKVITNVSRQKDYCIDLYNKANGYKDNFDWFEE